MFNRVILAFIVFMLAPVSYAQDQDPTGASAESAPNDLARSAASGIFQISAAAKAFYAENGFWPASIVELQDGGFLPLEFRPTTDWGAPYVLSIEGENLNIDAQLPDPEDLADYAADSDVLDLTSRARKAIVGAQTRFAQGEVSLSTTAATDTRITGEQAFERGNIDDEQVVRLLTVTRDSIYIDAAERGTPLSREPVRFVRVDAGAGDSALIQTDKKQFVFNRGASFQGDLKATSFADLDDTRFGVDANGVSVLNELGLNRLSDLDDENYFLVLNGASQLSEVEVDSINADTGSFNSVTVLTLNGGQPVLRGQLDTLAVTNLQGGLNIEVDNSVGNVVVSTVDDPQFTDLTVTGDARFRNLDVGGLLSTVDLSVTNTVRVNNLEVEEDLLTTTLSVLDRASFGNLEVAESVTASDLNVGGTLTVETLEATGTIEATNVSVQNDIYVQNVADVGNLYSTYDAYVGGTSVVVDSFPEEKDSESDLLIEGSLGVKGGIYTDGEIVTSGGELLISDNGIETSSSLSLKLGTLDNALIDIKVEEDATNADTLVFSAESIDPAGAIPSIALRGEGGIVIQTPASENAFRVLDVDGNSILHVDTENGWVGVNTNAPGNDPAEPSDALTVRGTVRAASFVATSGQQLDLQGSSAASEDDVVIQADSNGSGDGDIRLQIGSVDRAVLFNDGQFVISPDPNLLHEPDEVIGIDSVDSPVLFVVGSKVGNATSRLAIDALGRIGEVGGFKSTGDVVFQGNVTIGDDETLDQLNIRANTQVTGSWVQTGDMSVTDGTMSIVSTSIDSAVLEVTSTATEMEHDIVYIEAANVDSAYGLHVNVTPINDNFAPLALSKSNSNLAWISFKETDLATNTESTVGIYSGSSPATLPQNPAAGSIFMDTLNGQLQVKTGPGAAEWAVLTSSTAGSGGAGRNDVFVEGGNSFSGTGSASLGTTSQHGLQLITNSTVAMQIDTNQNILIPQRAAAGSNELVFGTNAKIYSDAANELTLDASGGEVVFTGNSVSFELSGTDGVSFNNPLELASGQSIYFGDSNQTIQNGTALMEIRSGNALELVASREVRLAADTIELSGAVELQGDVDVSNGTLEVNMSTDDHALVIESEAETASALVIEAANLLNAAALDITSQSADGRPLQLTRNGYGQMIEMQVGESDASPSVGIYTSAGAPANLQGNVGSLNIDLGSGALSIKTGSAVDSWSTILTGEPAATATTDLLLNGGNAFGAAITVGTTDSNAVSFITGGVTAFTIDTSQNTTWSGDNRLQFRDADQYIYSPSGGNLEVGAGATLTLSASNIVLSAENISVTGTASFNALEGNEVSVKQLRIEGSGTNNEAIDIQVNGGDIGIYVQNTGTTPSVSPNNGSLVIDRNNGTLYARVNGIWEQLVTGLAFSNGGNGFGTTAILGTTDNQDLRFIVNNGTAMEISRNDRSVSFVGPLRFGGATSGFNISSDGTDLNINSTGDINFSAGTSGNIVFNSRVEMANITGSGTGSALCLNAQSVLVRCGASLASLKTNIEDLDIGLEEVLALRPVSFEWIESGEQDIGLIAEEVEQVTPRLAWYRDGRLKGVRYNRLAVLGIRAIQQQHESLKPLLEAIEVDSDSKHVGIGGPASEWATLSVNGDALFKRIYVPAAEATASIAPTWSSEDSAAALAQVDFVSDEQGVAIQADTLSQTLPNLVLTTEEGNQAIDYTGLLAYGVHAQQHLNQRLQKLATGLSVEDDQLVLKKDLKFGDSLLKTDGSAQFSQLTLKGDLEVGNEFSIKRRDSLKSLLSIRQTKEADQEAEGYLSVRDVYMADASAWGTDLLSQVKVYAGVPLAGTCDRDQVGRMVAGENGESLYVCASGGSWRKIQKQATPEQVALSN